ncbi:triose-phosphate isomerase [Pararhizobium mangrovi]|uniref:Triosephosphate isomerase n=1 Tax=Pararhizobium mangrovi TaxID=2590452 RepID=A0A506UGT0_9HYPH|nr:triose-phosphate isomerase [Pararhizobium mangrovi]TPW31367.1 triose-phosphate isomerase [Pararhizobium mangrovi]
MTPGIRPLVAGNWKMNGLRARLGEIKRVADASDALAPNCDLLLCPPATLTYVATTLAQDTALCIGGQDCHPESSGAHTGDVSAAMLADCFATHVIAGHSERRADHGESDDLVRQKAEAAHAAGLIAIVCVGETRFERENGETIAVVGRQLEGSLPVGATARNTVIAYEPVWAIGTGLTPSLEDIGEVHDFLRQRTETLAPGMRLLYGGSVKPDNAGAIMGVANVDGALVGGASLDAGGFLAIAEATAQPDAP